MPTIPSLLNCPAELTPARLKSSPGTASRSGCVFEVYNTLHDGYLESVYERELEWELLEEGFAVRCQVGIPVFYKGVNLNRNFFADGARSRRRLKPGARLEETCDNFGHGKRLEWRKVTL